MMKKFLTTGLFLIIAQLTTAQFHIETGVNFNLPVNALSENYEFGAGLYLEPKYAVIENLDVGLYVGANGFAGKEVGSTSGKVDATIAVPILGTATYRFLSSKITPYAGIGLGVYAGKILKFEESALGGSSQSEENISEFGFAPRAGVYIGRMNLGVIYNSSENLEFWQFNLGVRILNRK